MTVMTLLAIGSLPLLLLLDNAAWAIDHPVDFSHLNIPNPIPDADPRYFISGGICAAASHGVTTPLDYVKTKIQSEPEIFQDQSLVQAATSMVQQDGPQALLTGLVPTIVGYGFEGGLKFGLYESLKPTFVQWLALGDDPTEGFLFASVAAGAVASIVLCPMEQTRIRMVTDPEFADGFVGGVVRLTKEEGAGAIFYGLPAMLSKQIPYVSLSGFAIWSLVHQNDNSRLTSLPTRRVAAFYCTHRQWQNRFPLISLLVFSME